MNHDSRWLFLLLIVGAALVSGCGETIDLYGESRLQTAEPVQAREDPQDNPHRNVKPHSKAKTPEPNTKTDYGASEGIFMIVPPADLNPNNVEGTQDPQIITIDFQKQYNWMPVQVVVDGKVIFEERLKTDNRGYADSVSFHYERPPARFTLVFPSMGMRETFTVNPDKGRFLGVAFIDGQLKLDLREGPFFYGK